MTTGNSKFIVGIGHSNGCNILGRATEAGARFDLIITINPAQTVQYIWSPSVWCVLCCYSDSDNVVEIARWSKFQLGLRKLAPKRWGAAGKYGFTNEGLTENGVFVSNYDLEEILNHDSIGHSDFSKQPHLDVYGEWLRSKIRDAYAIKTQYYTDYPLPDIYIILVPGFNTKRGHFAPVHSLRDVFEMTEAYVHNISAYGRIGTFLDWISVKKDSKKKAKEVCEWIDWVEAQP